MAASVFAHPPLGMSVDESEQHYRVRAGWWTGRL